MRPLGVVAAVSRGTPPDFVIRLVLVAGLGVPAFWLGFLLQLVLYRDLGWFQHHVGRLAPEITPPRWGILNARATVDVGYTILFIATLGFVGLGSRQPTAEWGAMIASARNFFLNNWWTMTFPGLALFLTVICLSLTGDAINDVVGLRGRKLQAGG